MKRTITFTIILIVLTACTPLQTQGMPDPVSTNLPQPNLPNPASVYCEENGGKLEIVTAADSSQSGRCVFSDGNTCDEWDYYRGECGPSAETSPTPEISVGTTSNAETDDTNGNNPGSFMPPGATEEIVDWWGIIKSTDPGAQFDDYFERQDLGQVIYFGIDSVDPVVKSQIESLRDSGKIVHLYGVLISNVPDYNDSQILVEHIEVEG